MGSSRATVIDAHRIPSEAAGYCYGNRVLWVDKEFWLPYWVDLSTRTISCGRSRLMRMRPATCRRLGHVWVGVAAINWDLQNTHATIWSPWGKPATSRSLSEPSDARPNIRTASKYGSPAGLDWQIACAEAAAQMGVNPD